MKKFGSIVFWVIVSLVVASGIFFLGDMLDAISYPQYAFAGAVVLTVALLIGYFAGKNNKQ